MTTIRTLLAGSVALGVLALAGCNDESALPRNSRHYVPLSTAMQETLREKNMRTHAPILIRAFKQESELEVWKQDSSGKLSLLKTFPMCRWSGQLGPKVREGDRQVPEGVYTVTQGAMNPNSSFYLSFNIGYPNAVDRQQGRTGAHIMVHGDCSSMGCFAMTDGQVADIYALTREAFAGGQKEIQLQSYPFRMTAENLAKYRNDPHIGFWRNLKLGDDKFQVTREPVKVAACGGKYVFGDGSCSGQFDANVKEAIASKQRADDTKLAEVIASGQKPVKRLYRDGDMHAVFKEQLFGSSRSQAIGTTRNGVSRTEGLLAYTPIEVPLETYKAQKAKGRSSMQIAELASQPDAFAPAAAAGTEAAKVDTAAVAATLATHAAAGAAPASAGAPASRVTATPVVAAAASGSANPPASAQALAPQPAAPSVFTRMMGAVGLSSTAAETPSEVQLEEGRRTPVNIALPPRRQAAIPQAGLAPSLLASEAVKAD